MGKDDGQHRRCAAREGQGADEQVHEEAHRGFGFRVSGFGFRVSGGDQAEDGDRGLKKPRGTLFAE